MDRGLRLFFQLCVCPHGLTDLWRYPLHRVFAVYGGAAIAVAAADDFTASLIFLVASAVHFAGDGAFGSLSVMTAVLALSSAPQVALGVLAFYMAVVHLPRHYEAPITAPCAAMLILAGLAFAAVDFDPSEFPRLTTALVVGHTVVNF
jgi:hypothetical protein